MVNERFVVSPGDDVQPPVVERGVEPEWSLAARQKMARSRSPMVIESLLSETGWVADEAGMNNGLVHYYFGASATIDDDRLVNRLTHRPVDQATILEVPHRLSIELRVVAVCPDVENERVDEELFVALEDSYEARLGSGTLPRLPSRRN